MNLLELLVLAELAFDLPNCRANVQGISACVGALESKGCVQVTNGLRTKKVRIERSQNASKSQGRKARSVTHDHDEAIHTGRPCDEQPAWRTAALAREQSTSIASRDWHQRRKFAGDLGL